MYNYLKYLYVMYEMYNYLKYLYVIIKNLLQWAIKTVLIKRKEF